MKIHSFFLLRGKLKRRNVKRGKVKRGKVEKQKITPSDSETSDISDFELLDGYFTGVDGYFTGSEISDSETEESDDLIEQGLGFLNNMYPNGRIPKVFVKFHIGLGEGFGLKYVSVISYASEVFLHLRQFDRVDGKLKLTPSSIFLTERGALRLVDLLEKK